MDFVGCSAGNWTYTHTIRRPEINQESVELRMPVTEKDYEVSAEGGLLVAVAFPS